MATYRRIVYAGDFGPWVSKLVLDLPEAVTSVDVTPATFNVFCAQHKRHLGEPYLRLDKVSGQRLPSEGYPSVRAAYASDEHGARTYRSCHVTLELAEEGLNKTIEGGILDTCCLDNRYRVTQLVPLPGADRPLVGLVFDECAGEECPATVGWHAASGTYDGIDLSYGYFEPDFAALDVPGRGAKGQVVPPVLAGASVPLVLWLHGAGEGAGTVPGEPERSWLSNRVTGLSDPLVQSRLGGAAYVLCPQSPTFWMDNGVERLGHSNQSVYSAALKALVEEFVSAHPRVDPDRVVVGGLSNGGFMTCRLLADYPHAFSCGVACCAPWYVANELSGEVERMALTPLWFAHSKGDEYVTLEETALPLVHELRAAGGEAHMTLFDHVEDLTGVHRGPDGGHYRPHNHRMWINVYHDACDTDLDGSKVLVEGRPVSMWEWAGLQRRR